MRATLITLLAALAGCYSSRSIDCAVRCGAGAQCANGFRCDDTSGLCVSPDFAGTCGGGGGDGGGGEATSACGTEHMIVMLDPSAPIPTGWRCVSCAGDPLFERFVVGSDKFGAQGGSTTHFHTFSTPQVNVAVDSPNGIANGGNGSITDSIHPASAPQQTSPADHTPPYRNVVLIEPLATVTELPKGAIVLLDTATLPSADYTRYSAQDGVFVHAGAAAGGGGTPTHTHSFNTTLPPTGTSGAAFSAGSIGAAIAHSHILGGTLPAFSNDPAHVVIVLALITQPTPLVGGTIAFFDVTPPAAWSVLSNPGGPLGGEFLKGGADANFFTQGSNTHDPGKILFASGTASASNGFASGGLLVESDVHTHTVPITFSIEDQRPLYTEVIIAKLGAAGCP